MKEVILSRGAVALVDDVDYETVVAAGPWHLNPARNTNYARRNITRPDGHKSTQSLHGFLIGAPWVDHVNGDGLDNRRANIRPSSPPLNAANRSTRRDSTSGFKGALPNRGRGLPWTAQICVGGKKRHLGMFGTSEEAARAYDAAAIEAWGDHARVNFPEVAA